MELFAYGLGSAIISLTSVVSGATPEEICSVRYSVPEREINEETEPSHDPVLFLYRRCLTKERKAMESAARVERMRNRVIEKGDRTKAYGEDLLKDSESDLNSLIRKQSKKDGKLQKRLDSTKFVKARQAARSARQEVIGTSRLNQIKLKLLEQNQKDPCDTVRVRTKNSPCNEATDTE